MSDVCIVFLWILPTSPNFYQFRNQHLQSLWWIFFSRLHFIRPSSGIFGSIRRVLNLCKYYHPVKLDFTTVHPLLCLSIIEYLRKVRIFWEATKFCEISTLLLTGTDKSKVEISQNYVAFTEYMSFNEGVPLFPKFVISFLTFKPTR